MGDTAMLNLDRADSQRCDGQQRSAERQLPPDGTESQDVVVAP